MCRIWESKTVRPYLFLVRRAVALVMQGLLFDLKQLRGNGELLFDLRQGLLV